jgi:hypothetical protein
MRWKQDFFVGYSPERINPGDHKHTLTKVCKVVAGDTPETLARVAELYGSVIDAGVYQASSIQVAEAAKVIENTQRDLNIALMNELALIFHKIGIDTLEVLEGGRHEVELPAVPPGLVGGHCIGVDPYYLTFKAEQIGYHPQVILAGRRINDGMGKFVADGAGRGRDVRLHLSAGTHLRRAEKVQRRRRRRGDRAARIELRVDARVRTDLQEGLTDEARSRGDGERHAGDGARSRLCTGGGEGADRAAEIELGREVEVAAHVSSGGDSAGRSASGAGPARGAVSTGLAAAARAASVATRVGIRRHLQARGLAVDVDPRMDADRGADC